MPHPSPRPGLATADLVLLAVLAGAVATFGLGYTYGLGNHVELLPHIERIMDPSFAAGDFSVEATTGGPRHYFARLCALLAGVIPLPIVFLLLTLLQNAGTALVTALAARKLFPRAPAAPAIAVLLAMALNGPRLGEAGFLRLPNAVGFTVATPLALASLWLGLSGRTGAALAAALPASLIHPLVGLEVSALGLAASAAERLGSALRARTAGAARKTALREGGASLLGLLGLGAFAYAVWFRSQAPAALDAASFIDIYARFRAPHHLWPSSFRSIDWVVAAAFLVAAAALARSGARREDVDRPLTVRIAVILAVFPAAALAGWFFVQVAPLRMAAILQPFRLTLVLKWLGYLLAAGALGGRIPSGEMGGRRRRRRAAAWAAAGVLFLLFSSLGRLGEADLPLRREGLTLAWLVLAGAAWLAPRRAAAGRLAATATAGLVIALVFVPAAGRLPVVGGLMASARPIVTLDQGAQREDGAALFCRDGLPAGSVLVVPPLLGRVRLLSRQALLADFKFMPTTDAALIEWRRRLEEAYGPWTGSGFEAARSMDRSYRAIGPDRLIRLKALFGVGYALLYAETPSRGRELYRDRFYKVVRIPDAPQGWMAMTSISTLTSLGSRPTWTVERAGQGAGKYSP